LLQGCFTKKRKRKLDFSDGKPVFLFDKITGLQMGEERNIHITPCKNS
jgi:hypothetical protein